MKKRIILYFAIVFLAVVLSISLSSAFWPFTKQSSSLNAQVINSIPNNAPFSNSANCIDSDGGTFSEITGNVSIRNVKFWRLGNKKYNIYSDYCINSTTLLENYCGKSARKFVKIKCENGCEDGACNVIPLNKYKCYETVKSNLCGPIDKIYPLNNSIQHSSAIEVYAPGLIYEDDNFSLYLEGPAEFIQFQENHIKIKVQNKKAITNNFDYRYIFNSPSCPILYNSWLSYFTNLPDAIIVHEGKDEFYRVSFKPLERKEFVINITPQLPTITAETQTSYLLFYYKDYTIYFGGLIKPGTEILIKDGQTIIKKPELIFCGNSNYSKSFSLSCSGEIGNVEYGYSNAKCCDNIFYPDFECCNNQDCRFIDGKDMLDLDGYCVDGLCMPLTKPANELFGNKKLLVGEFSGTTECQTAILAELDTEILNSLSKLEKYYDHMAKGVLNETEDFVNFNVVTILKLPEDLKGYYDNTKTEQKLIEEIEQRCHIDTSNYDILVFPTETTIFGGAAGFALGIGNSKVVFYNSGNTPTLIHEIGHLFGCVDLYNTGGRLQWSHALYGQNRVLNVPFGNPDIGPYNLIEEDRISNLTLKNFQVCRGYLGWTDNNKNNIVDVKEWR